MKIGFIISECRKRMFDYHSAFMWAVWLIAISVVAIFLIQREAAWELVDIGEGKIESIHIQNIPKYLNLLHINCDGPHIHVKIESEKSVCVLVNSKKNARSYMVGSDISFSVLKNKKTDKIEYRLSKHVI